MNYKLFLIKELVDQDVVMLSPGQSFEAGGERLTVVAAELGKARRWSRTDLQYVKDAEGYHWAIPYEVGLTESQESEGYHAHAADHGNPIHVKARMVIPKPVQTILWEVVL